MKTEILMSRWAHIGWSGKLQKKEGVFCLNYWSFQKIPEDILIRFKKGVHKEGCSDYWKNTNCFIEWQGTLTSLLFPGSYNAISSLNTMIPPWTEWYYHVFPCRQKILLNSHLNLYCNQSPTLRSHTENSWLFFSKKEFMWLKRDATSLLSFLFFSLISPVLKAFLKDNVFLAFDILVFLWTQHSNKIMTNNYFLRVFCCCLEILIKISKNMLNF